MTKIMLRYEVPSEFMCRLPYDTKCISCPNPMKVAVCEETFRVGFRLLLYLFIKHLLARYGLVLVQLHPNAWRVIINFMAKYAEVGLEPRIRALRSILVMKAGSIGRSVVCTSYNSNALTFLIFESLHKWSDSFFFVPLKSGLWAFIHVWRFKPRLGFFC